MHQGTGFALSLFYLFVMGFTFGRVGKLVWLTLVFFKIQKIYTKTGGERRQGRIRTGIGAADQTQDKENTRYSIKVSESNFRVEVVGAGRDFQTN